jgi:RND superfamily putative drug exporter
VLFTAEDARRPRALLLGLSGRAPVEGRLRVGGHLLPGREAWVRAHVGVAMLEGSQDPVREVRRALEGDPDVVVVDGLDALSPGPAHDEAAAALRDAALRIPGLTLLASSAHVHSARAVLADAGWPDPPVLDVSGPTTTPADADPAATAPAAPSQAADSTSDLSTEVHA